MMRKVNIVKGDLFLAMYQSILHDPTLVPYLYFARRAWGRV